MGMAAPQRSRVLRCCSCRLFQAHQVKKSLQWTCKACGEKQSFLRAYGEGSGADCRRHVQNLNLLQGQVSELSLRSPEEAVGTSERHAVPGRARSWSLQGASLPSQSRWLKYLDGGCPEPGPGRAVGLHTQPSHSPEQPYLPQSQSLPRKRRWRQTTTQLPYSLDVQDSDNAKVTLESQEDDNSLMGAVQQGMGCCLQSSADHSTREPGLQRDLSSLAPQVIAPSSKWARFLLSPGNSLRVDTEILPSIQMGSRPGSPAQAKHKPVVTTQPPQATHTPTPGPEQLCGKSWEVGTCWTEGRPCVQVSQEAPPVPPLCSLFTTGEDFDDDL